MCWLLTLYIVLFVWISLRLDLARAEHIVARRATMSHTYRRLLFISLSAFLIVLSAGAFLFFNLTSAAHAASNLVTNGGFETGNLSGWTCDAGDTVVTSIAGPAREISRLK